MKNGDVEKHDDTQPEDPRPAPGGPGTKPRWTSSAKTGVGTAVSRVSHVWFTIGQGVINELYYSDIDKANTRTIKFLITEGEDFFSDEEHDANHVTTRFAEGVPGYRIVSTCKQGRYRLTKEIFTESTRDTLLLKVHFEPLHQQSLFRLYLYIEPHLADKGSGNTGWVGIYHGMPMLLACRDKASIAATASVAFLESSCGFVGINDGYADLKANRRLTRKYNVAADGNIGITAELDWTGGGGKLLVTVGLGTEPAEAAQQARAGQLASLAFSRQRFIDDWKGFQAGLHEMRVPTGSAQPLYRISTAVLLTHESKLFPGAFIASLSLPWGFSRGDNDTGGYHVLWPRDLCETAMGLMACGDMDAGRRALFYLACTQKADGSWSQNMWLDGTEHWKAVQMDGIAMPILLADQLRRSGELQDYDAWPMVRQAAQFLVKMGPGTGEDRWEALAGYATFTMACEIAGLLAAADFAGLAGEAAAAEFLRQTADAWNDAIDTLTYAQGTELAKVAGVDGYYLRITPTTAIQQPEIDGLQLQLSNHVPGKGLRAAVDVVSPDALALVRFGMRSPHDPRMQSTVKVVDQQLRREMRTGAGWIRSTDDGYGEHEDGSPYNGHGVGHCWPLLAGERGHYAMALGDREAATECLLTISRQTSECGMIPEQVWSAPDIPEHQLYNGHPAGSGMPLAWAHAEYVKLLRSLEEDEVWDMPPQTVERYQLQKRVSPFEVWTENEPRLWVSKGKTLRMDFNAPASLSWKTDDAEQIATATAPPVLGQHSALLELAHGWNHLQIVVQQDTQSRTLDLRVR